MECGPSLENNASSVHVPTNAFIVARMSEFGRSCHKYKEQRQKRCKHYRSEFCLSYNRGSTSDIVSLRDSQQKLLD